MAFDPTHYLRQRDRQGRVKDDEGALYLEIAVRVEANARGYGPVYDETGRQVATVWDPRDASTPKGKNGWDVTIEKPDGFGWEARAAKAAVINRDGEIVGWQR